MHKKLLFGLIGAIVATGAFGEATTQTIPTQGYVDDNFQTKIPATGTNTATPGDTIVTYTDTAGELGERKLFNASFARVRARLDPYKDYLPTMEGLYKALENISERGGTNGLVTATPAEGKYWIPVFNSEKIGFNHILTVNSAASMNSSNDPSQYIPTMKAMEEKQNKMTCTRWLDNAEETDENCLLWDLGN